LPALQNESGVEWDLVNYGAGSFYVASYQDRGSAQAPATPKVVVESPDPKQDIRVPDCFFYRCWTALRSGCRAA
jgi:hypothetical protein